jgi:hypothetical protein
MSQPMGMRISYDSPCGFGAERLYIQRSRSHFRPFANHFRSSCATNSAPLSERMFSGIPRNSITSASVSITSYLPNLLATRIARHSGTPA